MSALPAHVQRKSDEIRERAELYCQEKIVEAVKVGMEWVARLDEEQRDFLVLLMADAWCAGALDAIEEVAGKQVVEQQRIAAQQRDLRDLAARRREP